MTFRIYESGKEFLNDNQNILVENPIETSFFKINAKNMIDMSNGFAIKYTENAKFILALRFKHFPMLIYGDNSLIQSLVLNLLKNNLTFDRILAQESTANSFINYYEKVNGGNHQLIHTMDIMKCTQINHNNIDISDVETAKLTDTPEIAELIHFFTLHVHNHAEPISTYIEDVRNNIQNYALIRADNKIVSMAKKTREDEYICAISNVYTRENYRCRGFSKKIIIYLTKQILDNGKIPYLYVDKTNPISNHLYSSIGYKYISPQMEIKYLSVSKK